MGDGSLGDNEGSRAGAGIVWMDGYVCKIQVKEIRIPSQKIVMHYLRVEELVRSTVFVYVYPTKIESL